MGALQREGRVNILMPGSRLIKAISAPRDLLWCTNRREETLYKTLGQKESANR